MTVSGRFVGAIAVSVLVALTQESPSARRSDGVERFAAIHFVPRAGAPSTNRATVSRLLARAARDGAALAVLPQFAIAGAPRAGVEIVADAIPGLGIDELSDLARSHQIAIVTSVPELAGDDEAYFVTTVLMSAEGDLLFHHRKNLPDAHRVDPRFRRGDPAAVLESVDIGGRRVGVLDGDDIGHGIARLSARGADTVLVTANWQETSDAAARRRSLLELAREHRVSLVVAAGSAALTGILSEPAGEPAWAAGRRETVLSAVVAPSPSPIAERAPLGLPQPPWPRKARANAALIDIGRELFMDARLSRDGTISCASCHRPEQAFTTPERSAAGVGHRRGGRNVPTLLNVAYRGALFWDGASTTLEHQTKFPMNHATEMGLPYFDVAARVANDRAYASRFREAGIETVGVEDVAEALAAFERTLLSGESPFDRYEYGGVPGALTPSAARGLRLFRSKARCSTCHTIGPRYALFSDQAFHNTGVGLAGGEHQDLGLGRLAHGGSQRAGHFLTPSLRNVALTAPYMHDGSLPSIEAVVDYYDRGGNRHPEIDREIRPLRLTAEERLDLVAFLQSLTGTARYTADARRVEATSSQVREPVRIGALQLRAAQTDAELNELRALARSAADRGARLVVLPEHLAGGPQRTGRSSAETIAAADRLLAEVRSIARELALWIAVPVAEPTEGTGHMLAIVLVDDRGREVARGRKLAPRPEFGDGTARPSPQQFVQAIDTPFGRVALVSGDDLARAVPGAADAGAGVILAPASWQPGDGVDWRAAVARLAREHGVTIAVANLRGASGESYGAIVGAGGTLAHEQSLSGGELVIADAPSSPTRAAPLGLPPVPLPASRAVEEASVALGERLFFDPILSRTGTVSCATCHDPARGFADARAVAVGVSGRRGTRNVPTLLNTAYRSSFAWDGAVGTLEAQIARALQDWAEMDSDLEQQVASLQANAEYRSAFQRLTGAPSVRPDAIVRALGDYVRTLVSGESAFDRFFFTGDEAALDASARRGFELFRGKAQCASCHRVSDQHALFSDADRHNTGVGYHPRFEYLGYAGHGLPVNLARVNNFRGEYVTPTLRNVAVTAPYMHDGSLATLAAVVEFYDRGAIANPFLDKRLRPLGLTVGERRDLVRFLESLTGTHETRAPEARTRAGNPE